MNKKYMGDEINRPFFRLNNVKKNLQKVHKKDLDILSGATMVAMRRILTKSSHFKKLFVKFS